MRLDAGNVIAPHVTPGLSRAELAELDERVRTAAGRIEEGRADGEPGYVTLNLPDMADVGEIQDALEQLPDPERVVIAGIGGSALGAATLVEALGSSSRLHVMDNVDPAATRDLIERVDLAETVVHAVSRSGRTTETLANVSVIAEAMRTAGVDPWSRMLVTTGAEGPLRTLADEKDLPALSVPAGVPGRYAALSTVGLPAVGLLGHDMAAVLEGGRRAVDALSPSLFDCAPYGFGAISYGLATQGATVHAMMPYGERLEAFAEWFAQLWAESLGKDGTGQIPGRALGVTDQHSQLQLYRAGPPVVQTSFLVVRELSGASVPNNPDLKIVPELAGIDLSDLLVAEQRATEASLAASGRPNIRLEIDRLDARSIGELLVSIEASCMMAGELFEINPFDQPAVEWAKRAIRGKLSGEKTAETRVVEGKTERRIG